MGKRREGREAAVQYLYQIDLSGETPVNAEQFWMLRSGPGKAPVAPKTRIFAEQLALGVRKHLEEIDGYIKKYTANYELDRLAVVDRNILRVAIYELLHSPDVAPVIIINEAIEVAKKFGTDKSGGFVNGILDRIKEEVGRPAREALSPGNS
ncbi:NusB antitermination factor [Chthoniobacter flavus Ellin428]|uniref:Transcription antitermination protein NusB n=1 Tax=Chthoniobacter flavus Ellin428 TaxID=497964 RepID=B4D6X5_9BACT|nr:transcription antitermination factor NusB [Chthoniobacter flavus]EDY17926.1 NusB antitermination factor [Chthoniobacter flavus Ellin428]TCO88533.1 NusB antitermination factor [Chthoniobacter flavus]